MEETGKKMYNRDNMIINPDIIEFEILTGARSILGQAWGREGGSEPYSRLYYVESGTGFIYHHGRRYVLRHGNMYLIPAHSEFSYGCTGKIVISWLHFNSHLRNGTDLLQIAACPCQIRPAEKKFVAGLFKRILSFLESDSPCAEFERRACLLLLLSQVLRHSKANMQSVSQDKFRRFMPVLNYIQSNLSQKISVGKMASIVKMAPESFSRAFSKCFSTGPAEYVRRKKIDMVRTLLGDSDKKLDDIAEEMGFTDAFHLSKTFKKFTGKSPSEFRKMRREIIP
jgi:AraC-like DNA-binding protein